VKTWRLGVVAAVLALAATGCGGSEKEPTIVSGDVTVTDKTTFESSGPGADCFIKPGSGYDDISDTAQVVVRDSNDKRIAVGTLEPGITTTTGGGCAFHFSIEDVPYDTLYSLEVGTRAPYTFKEADSRGLDLTLN
jgi:hypothetical protein